jgi:hypothetical protein
VHWAEATQSGVGIRPTVGRQFITEIAPCMDNEAFRGRNRNRAR